MYAIRYLRTPSRYAIIRFETLEEAEAAFEDINFDPTRKAAIHRRESEVWG